MPTNSRLVAVSKYLVIFSKIGNKILSDVFLSNFHIKNIFQLWKLITIFRHTTEFGLLSCKIDVCGPFEFKKCLSNKTANCDEINEEDDGKSQEPNIRIKKIDIFGCGAKDRSNWVEYPERLGDLLTVLGAHNLLERPHLPNYDLKNTLKEIWVNQCYMSKKNIRKALDQSGFNEVRIIGNF